MPSIRDFLHATRVLEFLRAEDVELYEGYSQMVRMLAPGAAFVPIRSATADVMTLTVGGTSYVLWDETHIFNLSALAHLLRGNGLEASHFVGLRAAYRIVADLLFDEARYVEAALCSSRSNMYHSMLVNFDPSFDPQGDTSFGLDLGLNFVFVHELAHLLWKQRSPLIAADVQNVKRLLQVFLSHIEHVDLQTQTEILRGRSMAVLSEEDFASSRAIDTGSSLFEELLCDHFAIMSITSALDDAFDRGGADRLAEELVSLVFAMDVIRELRSRVRLAINGDRAGAGGSRENALRSYVFRHRLLSVLSRVMLERGYGELDLTRYNDQTRVIADRRFGIFDPIISDLVASCTSDLLTHANRMKRIPSLWPASNLDLEEEYRSSYMRQSGWAEDAPEASFGAQLDGMLAAIAENSGSILAGRSDFS
jgi:hypothetical protein